MDKQGMDDSGLLQHTPMETYPSRQRQGSASNP